MIPLPKLVLCPNCGKLMKMTDNKKNWACPGCKAQVKTYIGGG